RFDRNAWHGQTEITTWDKFFFSRLITNDGVSSIAIPNSLGKKENYVLLYILVVKLKRNVQLQDNRFQTQLFRGSYCIGCFRLCVSKSMVAVERTRGYAVSRDAVNYL